MTHCLYVYLCLIWIIPFCYSQNNISLTEPRLTAITPINSTALNVTWQFADSIYDQSDFIRIYLDFYEFYCFNYGPIITSVNYTFTASNKTTRSLIRNFELVNAFYLICFSSNSTYTNLSLVLFKQTCQLSRTCLRSNPSICPSASLITISQTDVASNLFVINVHWLKNLPYSNNLTRIQLANNGANPTALTPIENSTHFNRPYRFSGLQSETSYTVNISVSYTISERSLTETMNYTVTTSRSSNFFSTGDSLIVVVCSVLLTFLFS